jgi:ferredoxin
VKVIVDGVRCVGAGLCVWAVPEVFDQSEEEGTVILRDPSPPESLYRSVEEAQIVCPAQAITIEDD